MAVDYHIDTARRLLEITFHGETNDAEFLRFYRRVYRDPLHEPGFDELVDCTGITRGQVSAAALRTLAEALPERSSETRPNHVAIVVPDKFGYALGRMYQQLTDPRPFQVRVFTDLAEARGWLAGFSDLDNTGDA